MRIDPIGGTAMNTKVLCGDLYHPYPGLADERCVHIVNPNSEKGRSLCGKDLVDTRMLNPHKQWLCKTCRKSAMKRWIIENEDSIRANALTLFRALERLLACHGIDSNVEDCIAYTSDECSMAADVALDIIRRLKEGDV